MAGGNATTSIPKVSGNVSLRSPSISGNVQGGNGRTILWGNITGDIENQEDLMIELHERDTDELTVQEIERILYVGL